MPGTVFRWGWTCAPQSGLPPDLALAYPVLDNFVYLFILSVSL